MKSSILPIYLLVGLIIFSFSCTNDEDDNTDDSDDDSPVDDDNDILDDDSADDDSEDDDVDDDDDSDDDIAPVISDAFFDPNPMEFDACEDLDDHWCSVLNTNICDPDNDLLPSGELRIRDDSASSYPMVVSLADVIVWPGDSLSQADNCQDPVHIGVAIDFGAEIFPPPPGEYCANVGARDSAGNFSNILNDVCVLNEPYQTM